MAARHVKKTGDDHKSIARFLYMLVFFSVRSRRHTGYRCKNLGKVIAVAESQLIGYILNALLRCGHQKFCPINPHVADILVNA